MKFRLLSKSATMASATLLLINQSFADGSGLVASNNQAAAYEAVKNQHPPKITQSKLGKAIENQAWSLQLTAKDADKQGDEPRQVYFKLLDGPEGFELSADGQASWTPGYADAGSHNISVEVSDGQNSSQKALVLIVDDANRAPQWQMSELRSAKEDVAFEQSLQASDEDNQALTFTLKAAPKGMVIDGHRLVWTPSFEQAGDHTFEVVASDGIAKQSQSFTITVENTNRTPELTNKPEYQLSENKPFTLQLKAKDLDSGDQEKLVYSKVSGPQSLLVSPEGVLSFTPSFDQAGRLNIVVAVSDGQSQSIQQFSFQVKDTNREPQWLTSELENAKEAEKYQATLSAQDPDSADALSYRLKSGPKGMTVSATGVIDFRPTYEQAGTHTVKVLVSDGKNEVEQVLTIAVDNVNRAPAFESQANVLAEENKAYKYKLIAKDADKDVLSYSLIDGPEGLTLDGNILVMAPGFDQAGQYPVRVQVSDGTLSSEQFFQLTIKNTNRAPAFDPVAVVSLSLEENAEWSIPLKAQDDDGDSLQYSVQQYPQGMSIDQGVLKWLPSFEQSGEHTVEVLVSDGTVTQSMSFTLNVANTNRDPSFVSEPVLEAKEAEAYQYVLKATDPDRSGLNFKLVSGPEGLVLDSQNLNTLTWKPGYQQSGEHEVVLEVSDGQSQVQQTYKVAVANTNRPPEFPEPVLSVLEDNEYSYHADAQDPDLEDKKAVTVTAVSLPDGVKFKNNTLSWTPDFKAAGEYPVVLSAADGDLVVEQKFTLTVENNNRKPEVTSKPIKEAHETLEYQYELTAIDADDEYLKYQLISGPEGMSLTENDAGAAITWTPLYSQGGKQEVVIGINDGIDTTEHRFKIKVENANRTPSLESIPDQTVVLGQKFQYQLVSSDVDGDQVSFKLVNGPKGMSLSSKGLIEYKAKSVTDEPVMIVVQADDGELKKRRRFEMTIVEPNE